MLLVAALLLSGCLQATTDLNELDSYVELEFQGLRPLDGGLKYQAWAVRKMGGIYQGAPFLVFNVGPDGELRDPAADTLLSGPFRTGVPVDDLYGISVSLELTEGSFSSASYTYLLGGEVVGKTAILETGHWLGMNSDLSGISGSYRLGTPTGADNAGGTAGVWFMGSSEAAPIPGLNLPDAEDGWVYEGWVAVAGDTLSTGRFASAMGTDGSNRFCGVDPAPGFPGEDFLLNPPPGLAFPLDLRGAQLFVTLEPWERWDVDPDHPFFLTILEAEVPASAAPGVGFPMVSRSGDLPRGSARVR